MSKRLTLTQTATIGLLALGIILVAISAFSVSAFLAILGVALASWGAILLYITPVKHVPLALLNASANPKASNIERILTDLDLTEKGIYLPPKNLKSIESGLVFVPKMHETALPTSEENTEKLYSKQKTGIFLTPPGLVLSQLFEHEIGYSFTKTDITKLLNFLPKLLVEDLELAESIEIELQGNTIVTQIGGSLLKNVCFETDSQPRTHMQVGCLLSSALACVFAKAIGKPIIIQKETKTPEAKTTWIEYQILEG